jgi:hypothetical protein
MPKLKPAACLNAPPGEAHIEHLDGLGEPDAEGYYWIVYPVNGKLERMRRDKLVFLCNMLRDPVGDQNLIHADGDPGNDAFSNLLERVH